MTGVDVEHTKARISYLRAQLDVCKVHRITPGPSSMEAAVSIAESLVAAVERVQALHVKEEASSLAYCRECGCEYPCNTVEALETKP
ncbi:hypothetical protein [Rhodococcus erythropolis]|uniref:hypothetical protein n=1 Tax=Rhodococcus erythropolis TaxID=1833 RepID=UPI00366E4756